MARSFTMRGGTFLGAASLAVGVAFALQAIATTPLPRAEQILFAPLDPSLVVLRSDSWGIYVSRDALGSFEFVCASAWEGDPSHASYGMALGADGTLYVASAFGGLWLSRNGCAFTRVAEVSGACAGGCMVGDVTAAQDGRQIVALAAIGDGMGSVATDLWQSDNAGSTWTKLGTPLPTDVSPSSVRIGRTNAQRVWVSGVSLAGSALVMRSDDGGARWQRLPLPPEASAANSTLRIFDLSPVDDDVIFVRAADALPDADSVWMSWDAGANFALAFAGSSSMSGLAFEPDGSAVWVSGIADGVWRASVDRLRAEGQGAFERVLAPQTFGLAWGPQGLYVGTDLISPERAMLGVLGADTILRPAFELCDAPLSACAAEACEARIQRDYPRCEATGEGDAGAGGVPLADPVASQISDDSSCACRAASQEPRRAPSAAIAACLALCLRRRRRR